MMRLEQELFLKEFHISEERWREARLTWEELALIAEDFEKKRNEYIETAQKYSKILHQCPYVHSLSYRVKKTTHLMEKIIRKNPKYLREGNSISITNYDHYITDLMGIRILLLFKEDWSPVHDYLMDKFGDCLAEKAFVYIRSGDERSLYEGKIDIIEERPYRSAHYLVKTQEGPCIEIQVRTLYEEAWSEMDHKLRYPNNMSNEMLTEYMEIMNRVTGMADEMGTFINSYIRNFEEAMSGGTFDDNEVYDFILHEIEKSSDEELKKAIRDKIRKASNYREMKKTSALFAKMLKEL